MATRKDAFRIDQIQTKRATFNAGSGLTYTDGPYGTTLRHAPVKISAEMTVVPCAAEDVPEMSLERIEADGACVVNILGAIPFKKGTRTAAATDFVADGSGALKAATSAGSGSKKRIASVVGDTAWVIF